MAAGSTIGTIFKVTTWGESHGKAIGVVVDGCPAGLPLCEAGRADLQPRERKETRSSFFPEFLRERQPEHRSP